MSYIQDNRYFFSKNLNLDGSLFKLFEFFFDHSFVHKNQDIINKFLIDPGVIIDNIIISHQDPILQNKIFDMCFNFNNEKFEGNEQKYFNFNNEDKINPSVIGIIDMVFIYLKNITRFDSFQEKFFENNLEKKSYLFQLFNFFIRDINKNIDEENSEIINKSLKNLGQVIDSCIQSIKDKETRDSVFIRFFNLSNNILSKEKINYIKDSNNFPVNRENVNFDQGMKDYFLIKRFASIFYIFLGNINIIKDFISDSQREKNQIFLNIIVSENLEINKADRFINNFVESFYYFFNSKNFKNLFVDFRFKDYESWDQSLKEFLRSYITNSIVFGYESFFDESFWLSKQFIISGWS